MAVLDIGFEFYINGAWVDAASYVKSESGITMQKGQSREGSTVDSRMCSAVLKNPDGRWSPRLATGPHYGYLTKNTPLRVSLPYGSSYMYCTGSPTSRATAPDSASTSITGDIDIRVEGDLLWADDAYLCGKYENITDQRSWYLRTSYEGLVHYVWSTDGTSANATQIDSTEPLPFTSGKYGLRVTHDVNNGASGNTVTFYYSSDFTNWTQLGDTVVTAGTTSLFNSTASLEVGSLGTLTSAIWQSEKKLLRFELRDGIAGTVVANPRFDQQAAGTTSFADTGSTPNTWTIVSPANVDDRSYRFWGEVPNWGPTADSTNKTPVVNLVGGGLLRRLRQSSGVLRSAAHRAYTRNPLIKAYWPCEDTGPVTQMSSAISGVPGMKIQGRPTMASNGDFYASDPLPTIGSSTWSATIPTAKYAGEALPADKTIWFYLNIPAGAISATRTILAVALSGSASQAWVRYSTASSGSLDFIVLDSDGAVIGTGGAITGINDGEYLCSLSFEQTAPNTFSAVLGTLTANDIVYGFGGSAVVGATGSTGVVRKVIVNPFGYDLTSTAIGHIAVIHDDPNGFGDPGYRNAYIGESAGARIKRLCDEEGYEFRAIGQIGLTSGLPGGRTVLGPQRNDTLVSILEESARTDGGMLYEPDHCLGIGFRTRHALYNQTPAVTIDYAAHQLETQLAPSDDDVLVQNDVTVTSNYGSSYRFTVDEGPLSILPPPSGAGLYDVSIPVNPYIEDDLPNLASWFARLGTIDQPRYPVIRIHRQNPNVVSDTTLDGELLRFRLGDRLVVQSPSSVWHEPDEISQLGLGMSEVLSNMQHVIGFHCVPYLPYEIGVADETTKRVDTDASELTAGVTSGATSLSVVTTEGPRWTTDAAEVPFDISISGETLTVSDIASSASDVFNRTESNGWGNADAGGAWTSTGGSASNFSVAAGTGGVHTLTTVNVARFSTLAVAQADVDVVTTWSASQLSTGAAQEVSLLARYADTSNFYSLRASLSTGGVITLSLRKFVAAVDTQLDTATLGVYRFPHSAATQYRMRLSVIGSAIKAKIWSPSTVEPEAWRLSASDTSLTAAGGVGVRSMLNIGNTNASPTMNFDNFELLTPQRFTCTRSVNGVVKALSAGAAVVVANPAYSGL